MEYFILISGCEDQSALLHEFPVEVNVYMVTKSETLHQAASSRTFDVHVQQGVTGSQCGKKLHLKTIGSENMGHDWTLRVVFIWKSAYSSTSDVHETERPNWLSLPKIAFENFEDKNEWNVSLHGHGSQFDTCSSVSYIRWPQSQSWFGYNSNCKISEEKGFRW